MAPRLPVGATRIRLPDVEKFDFTDGASIRRFAAELNGALVMALQQRPAITTPAAEKLLFSPSGDTYSITVADDGTVTSTLKNKVSP